MRPHQCTRFQRTDPSRPTQPHTSRPAAAAAAATHGRPAKSMPRGCSHGRCDARTLCANSIAMPPFPSTTTRRAVVSPDASSATVCPTTCARTYARHPSSVHNVAAPAPPPPQPHRSVPHAQYARVRCDKRRPRPRAHAHPIERHTATVCVAWQRAQCVVVVVVVVVVVEYYIIDGGKYINADADARAFKTTAPSHSPYHRTSPHVTAPSHVTTPAPSSTLTAWAYATDTFGCFDVNQSSGRSTTSNVSKLSVTRTTFVTCGVTHCVARGVVAAACQQSQPTGAGQWRNSGRRQHTTFSASDSDRSNTDTSGRNDAIVSAHVTPAIPPPITTNVLAVRAPPTGT